MIGSFEQVSYLLNNLVFDPKLNRTGSSNDSLGKLTKSFIAGDNC